MNLPVLMLAVCMSTALAVSVRAEVVVFAAASLKEPIDALAASFDDVVVSYGGSGTLARQVSLGAPADVILLANVEWMTILAEQGHVQSVADFASNRLVLIGPADMADVSLTSEALGAILGPDRIAVGLTEAVPAGIYAKAALISLGLWDDVSPHLAEMDNVRSALALVARGQAPLGIVYQTDVPVSDAVRAVAVVPTDSHPPIRYQGALTRDTGPDAAAFLAAVLGPQGQAYLADSGFLPAVLEMQ